MSVWVYSTLRRTCGRCNATIPAGAVALKLTILSAPTAALWRCQACVGSPPAAIIAEAENAATIAASTRLRFAERLAAIARRAGLWDFKMRQTGEEG